MPGGGNLQLSLTYGKAILVSLSELATKALALQAASPREIASAPAMLHAGDGSVMRWGGANLSMLAATIPAGMPLPVTVAVSPLRPGHAVILEYRVDGGPVHQVISLPQPRVGDGNARVFRAILPAQRGGLVEYLPVLRLAGQPISPSLRELVAPPRYQVGRAEAQAVTSGSSAPPTETGNRESREIQTPGLPLQWRVLSDGTECRLPIRYFNNQGLMAIFLTDFHRADALLGGTGLQAIGQEDGKAVVVLGCFEYRITDIGPYNEVALVIMATAPGDPVPAHYVVNLPVTTELAHRAGREIWGFNKFVTAIDVKRNGKAFSTTIRDPEEAIIVTLEGTRAASVPAPPDDLFMLSLLNGKTIKTLVRLLTPFQTGSGDDFVLKVGTSQHPMAKNLRSLGLDGTSPALVRYADPFQALLFPGGAM